MNRRQTLVHLGTSALAMNELKVLQAFAESLPESDTMPGVFIGHGSPMNAIEENRFVQGFRKIAASMPKPKAILCISAHWLSMGRR